MLLDLWDKDGLIRNFMELYGVSAGQICRILRELYFDKEQDNVAIFCSQTGVMLDEVDAARDLELCGKLVSTTTDDFECLREMGLVTLDRLLENDTPISRHLKKYQIEIRPDRHELVYMGQSCYIPYDEDCKWCSYGDEQCRYAGERYKDLYCAYLKAISPLAVKLYKDCCEIEVFLTAPRAEMLGYSTVRRFPEIFCTVEGFINDQFGERLSIGSDWERLKQHTYIATIRLRYDDLTYKNRYTCGRDGADATDMFLRYEGFCRGEYDCAEEVPARFWDNVWLINVCLDLIRRSGEASSEVCAGVKRGVAFPFDEMHIELV